MVNTARNLRKNLELVYEAEGTSRYEEGWRAGKPLEDPEKMKRWGFVAAKPSEYLVVVRRGKIDRKKSGQGARIFKWPWQSVAVIPTSLQRVEFEADQITLEKVGVRVTGIAVYRIVDPEIAYRVLNFTYAERASEKLAATLCEMFIGAARRLIANLTLDQCLTKRKEAIATFLMEEIAPVVSGRGSPEDSTDRGWGAVIDTIEIQNVRVQSEEVFSDLQAEFRSELRSKAALAELEREREVAERKAETERKISQASIESERETRILKAQAEAHAAETEAEQALRAEQARAKAAADEIARSEALERRRIEMKQGLALRKSEQEAAMERNSRALERERALAEIAASEEKRRLAAESERKALQVEAALEEQSHAVEAKRLEQKRLRDHFSLETDNALNDMRVRNWSVQRRRELEIKRADAEIDAEHKHALAEVEQLTNQARVMLDLVNNGLPSIAGAMQKSYGTVNYTQFSGAEGDSGPMTSAATTIAQIMTVAKSFGLDPSRLTRAPAPAAEAPTTDSAEPASDE